MSLRPPHTGDLTQPAVIALTCKFPEPVPGSQWIFMPNHVSLGALGT